MPGNIVAGNPIHMMMPRRTLIQKGLVKGVSLITAMGERVAAGTTITGEDIWRGNDLSNTPAIPGSKIEIPTPAIAGEQMTFISEDDADNGATATGILTLTMEYIQAVTGEEKIEIITLDGTTPVNTVAEDIMFVNDLCALTVGSNGVAEGNIRFYRQTDNTRVYGLIEAGGNKYLVPHRMVPGGKTLMNVFWHAHESNGKRAYTRLRATISKGVNGRTVNNPGIFCFVANSALNTHGTGGVPVYDYFPAFSILKASIWPAAAAGGADIAVQWEGELHTN